MAGRPRGRRRQCCRPWLKQHAASPSRAGWRQRLAHRRRRPSPGDIRPAQLRALLLDDLHATLLRSSQSTACSLSHSFRQRLARWLLTAQDRSDRDEFRITQELLARILGVRRATVSETIKSLEGRGILARMRGLIKIRDRDRLQEISCRCYRSLRVEEKADSPRARPALLPLLGLPFLLLALE